MKFTFRAYPAYSPDAKVVYTTEPDPLPIPPGWGKPSGWVGVVYPCPGRSVHWPACLMSAMGGSGKPCGGWHGTTHTVQVPGHPVASLHSSPDRVTMAERLFRQRQAWAERFLSKVV